MIFKRIFWCFFNTFTIEKVTRNRKHDFFKTLISKRPYGVFWGFFGIAALLCIQGVEQKYETSMLKSMLKFAYDFDSIFYRFFYRFWNHFNAIFSPFWGTKSSWKKSRKKEGCDPSLGGWRGGQWEPFWWVAAGKQTPGLARPRLRGRRADCLRFAAPAEALCSSVARKLGNSKNFKITF